NREALRVCAISLQAPGSRLQTIFERLAIDELEDQRGHTIRFDELVNRSNIRMIQRGERLGFAFEAGQAFGVSRKGRRQYLDGDFAPKLFVVGAIDLSHSASADQRLDLVAADAASLCQRHLERGILSEKALTRRARTRTGEPRFPLEGFAV